jgi:hypothetical protein
LAVGENREEAVLERPETYEITFTGQAGSTLRAVFDDCEVDVGPHSTTLRAEVPDPAGLSGLMQRLADLRLRVTTVRLVRSH